MEQLDIRQLIGEATKYDKKQALEVKKTNSWCKSVSAFAYYSPVRHSRLFCTRWNGIDKANGVMDALDDEDYKEVKLSNVMVLIMEVIGR